MTKNNKLPRPSSKMVDIDGIVLEALGNAMFRVRLINNVNVLGYVSGRLRRNSIRILVGDKVRVELSTYDLTKGRITYRFK
jgi:translation initiation factor IF-1